jgi:hypothetical protein
MDAQKLLTGNITIHSPRISERDLWGECDDGLDFFVGCYYAIGISLLMWAYFFVFVLMIYCLVSNG